MSPAKTFPLDPCATIVLAPTAARRISGRALVEAIETGRLPRVQACLRSGQWLDNSASASSILAALRAHFTPQIGDALVAHGIGVDVLLHRLWSKTSLSKESPEWISWMMRQSCVRQSLASGSCEQWGQVFKGLQVQHPHAAIDLMLEHPHHVKDMWASVPVQQTILKMVLQLDNSAAWLADHLSRPTTPLENSVVDTFLFSGALRLVPAAWCQEFHDQLTTSDLGVWTLNHKLATASSSAIALSHRHNPFRRSISEPEECNWSGAVSWFDHQTVEPTTLMDLLVLSANAPAVFEWIAAGAPAPLFSPMVLLNYAAQDARSALHWLTTHWKDAVHQWKDEQGNTPAHLVCSQLSDRNTTPQLAKMLVKVFGDHLNAPNQRGDYPISLIDDDDSRKLQKLVERAQLERGVKKPSLRASQKKM